MTRSVQSAFDFFVETQLADFVPGAETKLLRLASSLVSCVLAEETQIQHLEFNTVNHRVVWPRHQGLLQRVTQA